MANQKVGYFVKADRVKIHRKPRRQEIPYLFHALKATSGESFLVCGTVHVLNGKLAQVFLHSVSTPAVLHSLGVNIEAPCLNAGALRALKMVDVEQLHHRSKSSGWDEYQ